MGQVIYSQSGVEVTATMARFGNTSYPVKNIGAVTVNEEKAGYKGAGVMALILGPLSLIWLPFWVCLVLVGIGVLFLFKKPDYKWKLMLATSSGNVQAYESNDRIHFQRIVSALEEAIATKG